MNIGPISVLVVALGSAWGKEIKDGLRVTGTFRRVLVRAGQQVLSFLLVLMSVVVASVFGLTQEAVAQNLKSLQAHLGFLSKKPQALPLTLPTLQLSHIEGSASYVVAAPRTGT